MHQTKLAPAGAMEGRAITAPSPLQGGFFAFPGPVVALADSLHHRLISTAPPAQSVVHPTVPSVHECAGGFLPKPSARGRRTIYANIWNGHCIPTWLVPPASFRHRSRARRRTPPGPPHQKYPGDAEARRAPFGLRGLVRALRRGKFVSRGGRGERAPAIAAPATADKSAPPQSADKSAQSKAPGRASAFAASALRTAIPDLDVAVLGLLHCAP